MDNNKKEVFPLVSVLIPTYNRPYYFKNALESVLKQTYKNIEIIICDDSTNNDTKKLMKQYLNTYKNIKYYHNGGPLGVMGVNNGKKCLELSSGEYINFLMHDDIFHPNKILRMVEYLNRYKNISMVTSRRRIIDENGKYISHAYSKKIYNNDTLIRGKDAARKLIMDMKNFIGEPTTVLFRKKDIEGYAFCDGRQYIYLLDVSMWLRLCSKGDCMYISDILSCYRFHKGQNSQQGDYYVDGYVEWIYIFEAGYKLGFISRKEYDNALIKWKSTSKHVINIIKQKPKFSKYLHDLKNLKLLIDRN